MEKRKRFYLPVDNQLVEVTSEVYQAYYQSRRYIKYKTEQEEQNGVVSYNALDDGEVIGEEMILDPSSPSSEEVLIAQELRNLLHRSILTLPEEDQTLIHAIFYEGQSDRGYGKHLGISHTAVRKRRERILDKLRKLMNISDYFLF